MAKRILILGGTTEARLLAGRLAALGAFELVLSLAGRTAKPVEQPVPIRVGGFGGTEGLARHLVETGTDLLVDATHPYARRISAHACAAAEMTGTPAFALARLPWEAVPGDRWRTVADVDAAVAALDTTPRRVFLALGRQEAAAFAAAPRHSYWVRSVDPVEPPLDVPDARYILARGPFETADEEALFRDAGIEIVVAKNSGGAATYAKVEAARRLGLDMILIARPPPSGLPDVRSVEEAMAEIHHRLALPWKRGA